MKKEESVLGEEESEKLIESLSLFLWLIDSKWDEIWDSV